MIDPFVLSLTLFVVLMGVTSIGIDRVYRTTREGFFVSNRQAPIWQVAFSAASSWMYVFAIVMSATFAVEKGLVGSLWYTIPYVLTIAYFGVLGYKLLSKLPKGFTLSQFIEHRYGNSKMTWFYRILTLAATIYAITANLTGFGIITEYVSKDFSYNVIIGVLGFTALAYSMWGGIRASQRTDTVQMILVMIVSIVFGTIAVNSAGGVGSVIDAWETAKPSEIFNTDYMLNPGLVLLLLFAGSIMADNGAWQNIYSLGSKERVVKTYIIATAILVVTYIGLSMLAATVFSFGIVPDKPALAGIVATEHVIGYTGVVIFVLAVLSKAASTCDTALNSAGNIVANDMAKLHGKDYLFASRTAMAVIIIAGMLLAALKIDLWILITTFGVFRLLAVAPTLYGLFTEHKINGDLMFWSMLTTGIFGLVMSIGQYMEKLELSIVMISIPALTLVYQRLTKK